MSFSFGSSLRKAAVIPAMVGALVLSACGGGSLGAGGGGEGGGGADGPVKIGVSVPKSGVYAALGKDMEQGFKLYLEQHDNKLGGKEVQLVEVDEGAGPQTGVPATERLITQDQVGAVVGIVNSATAAGLQRTFNESEVPLIVTNAGADTLTETPSDYIWRTSFTNGGVAEALGPKAKEELGDGSVFLMAPDYAAGKEATAGFKKSFEAAGGTIAGEVFTPFGQTTDYQPYLNQVRTSGAKGVYVFYAGAEAVAFVQQFKQFLGNEDIQLYGSGFLTEGSVLDAQGEAADGVKTVLHYSDQIDSPRNKEFVENYTAKWNMAPTVYSVQTYDAAAVLDKALESADGVDGKSIAAALKNVGDIDSPRGTWRFNESHDPDQPYWLREVQEVDGKRVNAVVTELTAG
ncbi:ABC transporter substrate-binding protein [Granulicoccus sp. GXG6511]|uniref:ABC transporter substrate-binding protein n=1 Tax=Granulicoccus sp. GXG6511 TaxID=3381351 RepID=UPI003D7DB4FD